MGREFAGIDKRQGFMMGSVSIACLPCVLFMFQMETSGHWHVPNSFSLSTEWSSILNLIHYRPTHPDLFFNISEVVLSIRGTPARDAQLLTSHRVRPS